jgi:adenosylmethionine---8-amino-7-oxononanoate aminotransferase
VQRVANLQELVTIDAREIAGAVIEPLIQGAAGMRTWPPGMLKDLRNWCDAKDVFLIFDEVMTGFGRSGRMFAFEHENVSPDFLTLAKGLTGGYLPLGATLTTQQVFDGFLGGPERTFYYGHSYSGNQLGCAAALASLDVFRAESTLERLEPKIIHLEAELMQLRTGRYVSGTRQCGFIAGVELGREDGSAFPPDGRVGSLVCDRARHYQLLTRPIGNVIVLMLPLCANLDEIGLAATAIGRAIDEVCGAL